MWHHDPLERLDLTSLRQIPVHWSPSSYGEDSVAAVDVTDGIDVDYDYDDDGDDVVAVVVVVAFVVSLMTIVNCCWPTLL